jgi:hypothetical protein
VTVLLELQDMSKSFDGLHVSRDAVLVAVAADHQPRGQKRYSTLEKAPEAWMPPVLCARSIFIATAHFLLG